MQALCGASFPACLCTSLLLSIFLCLSLSSQPLTTDSSEVPQLVESSVAGTAKMTAGTPVSLPPSVTPSANLPSCYTFFATPLSLHSVGAVAPVVHCSGDGYYDSRHAVSCQVEVLSPGVFTLKHLYQHDVELYPFQEHPGEGCQEEEMEQGCKNCTGNLLRERRRWFKNTLLHTVMQRKSWKVEKKIYKHCKQ